MNMYRISFFDYTNNEEEIVYYPAESPKKALIECEKAYNNIYHSEMQVSFDHRIISEEEIANEQSRIENSSGWVIEAAYKVYKGCYIDETLLLYIEDRSNSTNSKKDAVERFNYISKERLRHLNGIEIVNVTRYDKSKYNLIKTFTGISVEKK